jgi:heme/copper-type cytochrome/quinol oxidase subunit 2
MLKGLNFFEVVLSKNGIQRDYVGNNSFFTQSDAPLDYQIGFQDPGVPQMEGILNFHHDLFFFLIVILGVVLWLLFRIITTYSDYLKGRKKITHKESVTIEII